MIIVAGQLLVDPARRERYLAGCTEIVRQARAASGCLDFAISPDLTDPGRINVFERWETREAVEAFRGSGPTEEQNTVMISASVAEYDAELARSLT
ncbi:putative quinol monooxygenase [Parafrankia elaeagni]|uniref:putative quinol monooxygenase n=1 Tax=Parafrankia elaeagni TaxID=222534 RepID=UPI00047558DB|nr:antibiotic biosynthesis monooxygenase [Parafrankia elaeagni]